MSAYRFSVAGRLRVDACSLHLLLVRLEPEHRLCELDAEAELLGQRARVPGARVADVQLPHGLLRVLVQLNQRTGRHWRRNLRHLKQRGRQSKTVFESVWRKSSQKQV